MQQKTKELGCGGDDEWLLVTLRRGVNETWVYSFVFENYRKLFRRDVMWRERNSRNKVRLCGTHGPEKGVCVSIQMR